MQKIEDDAQLQDWWQYGLTPYEEDELYKVWASLLFEGRVEQGQGASITGNLIACFKRLKQGDPYWAQRLDVEHRRNDKKYDQMYRKIQYLTRQQPPSPKKPTTPGFAVEQTPEKSSLAEAVTAEETPDQGQPREPVAEDQQIPNSITVYKCPPDEETIEQEQQHAAPHTPLRSNSVEQELPDHGQQDQ